MDRSLTRQELYNLVWSQPMRTLATHFGISDVALAKACRNHDVPIPPRGYWAKRQAGKKVSTPPLPDRGLGRSELIRSGGRSSYYETPKNLIEMEIPKPPEFPETLEALTARVQKLVGKASIPRDLTKAHRAISKLLEEDSLRRQKYLASSYRSSWDAPLFDSPFERRRLRLTNAIFVTLERCGMRATLRGKDPSECEARIGDEHVTFKLDHPKQQQRWGHRSQAELDRPASDKLRMVISPHSQSEYQKSWEDDENTTVEEHVTDIVVALIVAGEMQYRRGEKRHHEWLVERKADLIKEERRRKEEEEQKERERRVKEEQTRIDRLLGEAVAFRQATDIRAYVELVRQASQTSSEPVDGQELELWAAWAIAQADRIDPVRSRRFLVREETSKH